MITGVSEAYKAKMTSKRATIYVRVDLLDKYENLVEQIQGKAIDGSVSVDKERDVRREFSLALQNKSGLYTWGSNNKIWLDKRIKLHVGFETPSGIEFAPQGVFFISSPSVISKPNGVREVRLQGGDKWRQFEGQPLGRFTNVTTIDPSVNIGDAIRTLAVGETKFAFELCTVTVPYRLTYQIGEARGKAMKELADLAGYSLYYDVDGFLRFQPKSQDLTIVSSVSTYDKNDKFTLYAGAEKTLDESDLYNKVVVIGGSAQTGTVSAVAVDSDPNSPLSTVNIGERLLTYNNGSPDPLITTVALAQARADYELQQHAKIVERQKFECVPNYLHEAEDVITIVDDGTGTNDKYELIRFNIPLRPALMSGEAWRIRKVGA